MDEYVTGFNWDSVDEFGNPWFVTRERVVRCRDCEHWRMPSDREKARCTGAMAFVEPTPDGFCAWGEPRKGE